MSGHSRIEARFDKLFHLMKVPLMVLSMLALYFWVSAAVLLLLAFCYPALPLLRWVGLADLAGAAVITVLAVRQWKLK